MTGEDAIGIGAGATDRNRIPPIVHELGHCWPQPDMSAVLIDDRYALMDRATMMELLEYSTSTPSAAYEGKCWRLREGNRHYLRWFGHSSYPGCVSVNEREILLID